MRILHLANSFDYPLRHLTETLIQHGRVTNISLLLVLYIELLAYYFLDILRSSIHEDPFNQYNEDHHISQAGVWAFVNEHVLKSQAGVWAFVNEHVLKSMLTIILNPSRHTGHFKFNTYVYDVMK